MLSALLEADLVPTRVSGSSAGALIAGLWAAGLDPSQLAQELRKLTRKAFWDPAPGLGMLRGRLFRELLHSLLPVKTFADTRVPLAISVYEPLRHRTLALTEGELAPAIQASCAVPLMFHPVRIGERYLLDGGVLDRWGMYGMPTGRVLYHHLTATKWRSKNSPSMRLPRGEGVYSLAIHGMPRPSPVRLDLGLKALDLAYERTRFALEQPVLDGAVTVHA
jgi:NTE family protein